MRKNSYAKYIHFIITVLIFCIFWNLNQSYIHIKVDSRYSLFVYVIYAALFYFFSGTYNCYQLGYETKGELIYSQTIASVICIFGSYMGISVIWNRFYPILMYVIAFGVQTIWNILWCIVATDIYFRITPAKETAVIYRDETDLNSIREIYESRLFKVTTRVQVADDWETPDILDKVREAKVLFVTGIPATLRNGIAKYCADKDVEGYFLPHVGDVIMGGAHHVQSFSVPLQKIQRADTGIVYDIVKRAFDIICSLLGIIITSPIILIVSLAIKLGDGGRVLYSQDRLTKDGKVFRIYKFRSMREDAEADGVARLAAENDDRITKVGRVIRACRLDELPQLINILKGDMSFVGPRPERPEIAEKLTEENSAFSLRLQVQAGLTGYAQVYGKYNTNPSDKLKMDLIYINNMSLIMDLQLIFATVKILFIKDSTEGIKK